MNKEWKQEIKLGKKNNQKFVEIPFDILIDMITYKDKDKGIDVITTEESHTSKCSFFDNEEMCHHDQYQGKRNIKENELKEDCLGLQIEKPLTVMLMGL